MRRNIFILIFAACLLLASCVSTSNGGGERYLIRAKNDSGFVIAYQAHFALDGESFRKISSRRFESLTLGSDSEYEAISARTYSFYVLADGENPDGWKFNQNEYDDETYDVDLLVRDLRDMGISYSGSLYVLVTCFDDYRILDVSNLALDMNSVTGESYALFKNDVRISLPKDTRLCCLRYFYRRR